MERSFGDEDVFADGDVEIVGSESSGMAVVVSGKLRGSGRPTANGHRAILTLESLARTPRQFEPSLGGGRDPRQLLITESDRSNRPGTANVNTAPTPNRTPIPSRTLRVGRMFTVNIT